MALSTFDLALRIIQPRLNTLLKLQPDAVYTLRQTVQAMEHKAVSYKPLTARTAYLYAALAADVHAITQLLNLPQVTDHFDTLHQQQKPVRIAVFGAKAGAVYPAVVRWLERIEHQAVSRPVQVQFTLFEGLHHWQDDLLLMHRSIQSHYLEQRSRLDLTISGRHYYDARAGLNNFHLTDVLTPHDLYLFTDAFAAEGSTGSFRRFAEAANRQPDEALFVFMERASQADRLEHSLNLLMEYTGFGERADVRLPAELLEIPAGEWHFIHDSAEFHDLMQCIGLPPFRRRSAVCATVRHQPNARGSGYAQHFALR